MRCRAPAGTRPAAHQVGQCDRDGIGGVGRTRGAGEPEQLRHHETDLRLERCATTHNGLLHEGGRILGDRQFRLGRSQENDATRMSEDDGRANIFGEEESLDGHLFRPEAGEQRREIIMNAAKPGGERIGRRRTKYAPLDQAGPQTRGRLHDAVSGDRGAGIDPEHSHGCTGLRR